MKVYSSSGDPLVISDTPMSKGGEGCVFKIPGLNKYCAKIYHPGKRTNDRLKKLEYMVKNAPSPLITKQYIICWPTKIIFDSHKNFLGFVMPMAFENSVLCYEICRMGISYDLSEDWNTFYNRHSADGIINRLKLLVNIALPIHTIHSIGKYVLVDFKPQNMLITADGRISIIDLDSVQICDKRNIFLCPVATPEYLPPELQHNKDIGKVALTVACDRFALAVIFYQILYGLHPFTVTAMDDKVSEIRELIAKGLFPFGKYSHMVKVIPSPHNKYKILPKEIQSLFRHAFEANPNARPSAEQWGMTIFNFIQKLPK